MKEQLNFVIHDMWENWDFVASVVIPVLSTFF